jgi:hypothetical protein
MNLDEIWETDIKHYLPPCKKISTKNTRKLTRKSENIRFFSCVRGRLGGTGHVTSEVIKLILFFFDKLILLDVIYTYFMVVMPGNKFLDTHFGNPTNKDNMILDP